MSIAIAADFSTPLTGTVTIYNNTATFTLTTIDDLVTEGPETLVMGISSSAGSTALATAPSVIVADSTIVIPPVTVANNVIIVDTSRVATLNAIHILTASVTLMLPPTPSINDEISFSNRSGTLTCKLDRNGSKIMGIADDLTLDSLASAYGRLVYTNAAQGWVFI